MKKTKKPSKLKLKAILVGHFGGELKPILASGETVSTIFDKAGMTVAADEEVLTGDGDRVKGSDVAAQGQTYYITTKQVSQ